MVLTGTTPQDQPPSEDTVPLSDGTLASPDQQTYETNAVEESVEAAENETTVAQPLPGEGKTGNDGEASEVTTELAADGAVMNLTPANQVNWLAYCKSDAYMKVINLNIATYLQNLVIA